jgi:hypothetical protein
MVWLKDRILMLDKHYTRQRMELKVNGLSQHIRYFGQKGLPLGRVWDVHRILRRREHIH